MAYQTPVDSQHPLLIMFLKDESSSMDAEVTWNGGRQKMCEAIASLLNSSILQVASACRPRGALKDYAYFSQITYGGEGVKVGFGGKLDGKPVVSITDMIAHPLDFEPIRDGQGDPMPRWVHAKASGGTPMCAGFEQAIPILTAWCIQHPDAPAPVVIQDTDGESTDGDPSDAAGRLCQVGTNDGPVVLFNVHLSAHSQKTASYPDSPSGLDDKFADLLFNMSSVLPEPYRNEARRLGVPVTDKSRAMVFNASPADLWRALRIGTLLNR